MSCTPNRGAEWFRSPNNEFRIPQKGLKGRNVFAQPIGLGREHNKTPKLQRGERNHDAATNHWVVLLDYRNPSGRKANVIISSQAFNLG